MKLELAIHDYAKGAVFDHYDDGSFASFDAVTVEIVGGERDGEQLVILVEPGSTDAKRWNRPGATLQAAISPERLDLQTLFSGAFTIEGDA